MHSKLDFLSSFEDCLGVSPTDGQRQAMDFLSDFVCQFSPNNELFILTGYAGTGKTTLVSALVKVLYSFHRSCVLLAPTGRAAKVFASYSSKKAYTIHKLLYYVKKKEDVILFSRRKNEFKNTIFLVDEVSMLSDARQDGILFSSQTLLEDLFSFVYEGENCKLIFIGDDAQLPPVNATESPALNPEYLKQSFNVTIYTAQLLEVVRQSLDSGILYNANRLRGKIKHAQFSYPLFTLGDFQDFQSIDGRDLEEQLNSLYAYYGSEEVVVITRSNKRAYSFNSEIRNRIFFRENRIATGDYIMAVKNNYFWLDESSEVGFIANGDILEIVAINSIRELYGFSFADVTVRLCDYPNYPTIDIKLWLESLESDEASLPYEKLNLLYHAVAEDYADIQNKRTRYLAIKNDPYLNAVQVKFAYSLTCHKTQGGQWKVVMVDRGFATAENSDKEYLRWLYTAVTRASEKVYLINFKEDIFEKRSL